MSEHSEELARLRAQMDQAIEAGTELAKGLWAFYSALVAEGSIYTGALNLTEERKVA